MALAFVQKIRGSVTLAGAGLGTAFGTFATNPAGGNLIAVAVGFDLGAAGTVNSVADTPVNTYTRIGNGTANGVLARIDLYYAQNVTGGTNIVKVIGSFTAGAGMGFQAYEISGASTTSALDKSAFGTGVTDITLGLGTTGTTAATTNANTLLFAAFTEASLVGTLGSGWLNPGTVLMQNPWSLFVETKIVSATGAYAGTFSTETVTNYAGGVAAFAQAAAVTTNPIGYKNLLGVGQ